MAKVATLRALRYFMNVVPNYTGILRTEAALKGHTIRRHVDKCVMAPWYR
jgi:hypothetical protein